jgi:hypothetical protein
MNAPVISAALAVALTTGLGVSTLKHTPSAGLTTAWGNTNFEPGPLFIDEPKPPGIYISHPYLMQVMVPGQVDATILHEAAPNPWADDCVQDPHIDLVPRR